MELGGLNTGSMEQVLTSLERFFVSNGQVQVGGMVVSRATMGIGVFNGGMAGLNSLLREGEIAA